MSPLSIHPDSQRARCQACHESTPLGFDFTMAFQPFVDIKDGSIFGYEALVRGTKGEGAASILSQVTEDNRYRFDQSCRTTAIELAGRLNLDGVLSINFLPNAVYRPETCIRATLEAAERLGFAKNKLMFEVTEGEQIRDVPHLQRIFTEYKKQGFRVAIDDFGAGYAGLNLLADFQPDFIKLDMALTRNIDTDKVRRSIVRGIMATCRSLSLEVIAEGVETREECLTLAEEGIEIFQGYFFAKPGFESLPALSPEALALVRGGG